VVIPLVRANDFREKMISNLCPTVEISGEKYVALTQQLA